MRRPSKKTYYTGKSILITGGARGLGFIMARLLAKQGTKIMLVSRSEEELLKAKEELRMFSSDIHIFPADLRDPDQINSLITNTLEAFGGRIDVLIHNAGVIDAGPYDSMSEKDFKSEMDIHFWAALYLAQSVVPIMKKQKRGNIINISSFGGQIAVPHFLPYCASKFALSGFSEGLGIELDRQGIKVSTIYPGLIRTGSIYRAKFRGEPEKEKRMMSAITSLPIISMNAEKAARQILRAGSRGQAQLTLTIPAKLGARLHALFPNLWISAFKMIARALPNRVRTVVPREGRDVEDKISEPMNVLNRKAAERNNELAS